MTAVEIFFEDLVHLGYIEYPDESLVQDRLKLALELEKHQIIDAHLAGQNSAEEVDGETEIEYYNETYK
jgi:hypothetical protein